MPVRPVVAQIRKGGLVAQAEQRRAGHPLLHLGGVAQHPLHQRLGQDQPVAVEAGPHVGHVGIDGDGGVRDQGPGHGRPGEQRDARVVQEGELDEHGGIDRVPVAEGHLVARQRGAVARAVRHHLVALGQQALLPHLLQRPPDRLDVVVVEREVGLVSVDPEADPLRQRVPLVDVAQHRLAALGVELLHAVALDVRLRGEAELLLDLELDRQAVAVPAGLARDEVAAHRLVARKNVLENTRQDVVGPGPPVGRGRALVEDEAGRALAAAHRFVEHVALAPALEHGLLELREGLRRVNGGISSHECVDSRRDLLTLLDESPNRPGTRPVVSGGPK